MLRRFRVASAIALVSVSTILASAPPGISLVGIGYIPGSALDKSGLAGVICQAGAPANCIPRATFGGLGSDLAYTGHDNVFIAAPDRGPFDGLTDIPYLDRVHFLHLVTNPATKQVTATLLDTRLLKNRVRRDVRGLDGRVRRGRPEHAAPGPRGDSRRAPTAPSSCPTSTVLTCSSSTARVTAAADRGAGQLSASPMPNANPNLELSGNTSGRQANRGMEGLAISPDGGTLFGMMQNALLQDNALTPGTINRRSNNTRILQVDLATGLTKEYVYHWMPSTSGKASARSSPSTTTSSWWWSATISRGWRPLRGAPTRKSIYRIDVTGATDVTGKTLPATGLPAGVKAVGKELFINMLDPDFGLDKNDAQGDRGEDRGAGVGTGSAGRPASALRHQRQRPVAREPDADLRVRDRRHQAAETAQPAAQTLPGPLYPPGQVKKALGKDKAR